MLLALIFARTVHASSSHVDSAIEKLALLRNTIVGSITSASSFKSLCGEKIAEIKVHQQSANIDFHAWNSAIAQTEALRLMLTAGPTHIVYRNMCANNLDQIQVLQQAAKVIFDISQYPEFSAYLTSINKTAAELIAISDTQVRMNTDTVVDLTNVKNFFAIKKFTNVMWDTANLLENIFLFDPDDALSSEVCLGVQTVAKRNNLKCIKATYWSTNISDDAFKDAKGLVELLGFTNVTSLGSSCFYGCSTLVTIGNVSNEVNLNNTSMGANAFEGCSKITKVAMPDLDSIPNNAFKNCRALTAVTCKNALSSLGASCFQSCSALKKVGNTENKITYTGTSMGNSAFEGCLKIIEVIMNNVTIFTSAFKNCSSLVTFGATANEVNYSGTTMGESAFEGCSKITKVIMNSLNPIPAAAFRGCSSLITFGATANEVNYSGTTMGESAFEGCSNITKVKMNSLNPIPASAFKNCISLVTFGVTANEVNYSGTSMGKCAFEGCYNITKVKMNSLNPIPASAFKNCISLVTFGATANEVNYSGTSMGESAFEGCYKIIKVIMNSLNPIPASAFKNCSSLVTFGATANEVNYSGSSLGKSAFEGCSQITKVIMNNLNLIPANAFSRCTSLSIYGTITPESLLSFDIVTEIGDEAFLGCPFTSIIAPELISAGSKSFAVCTGLTGFVARKMTSAGDSAFYGTKVGIMTAGPTFTLLRDYRSHVNLDETCVFIAPNLESIGERCFESVSNMQTVVLPKLKSTGTKESFSSTGITQVEQAYLPSAKHCFVSYTYGIKRLFLGIDAWFATESDEIWRYLNWGNLVEIGLGFNMADLVAEAVARGNTLPVVPGLFAELVGPKISYFSNKYYSDLQGGKLERFTICIGDYLEFYPFELDPSYDLEEELVYQATEIAKQLCEFPFVDFECSVRALEIGRPFANYGLESGVERRATLDFAEQLRSHLVSTSNPAYLSCINAVSTVLFYDHEHYGVGDTGDINSLYHHSRVLR